MKILVACEESQAVTIEFRKLGFEAYSCDILPCSGGHPEWHLQQDVTELLAQKWDAIIAFPPCTHLAVSGAAHFKSKREDGRQEEAIHFFMKFINADCDHICVENPVGIIGGDYIRNNFPEIILEYGNLPKSDQKIQPWEYGHEAQKTTCLWLKGLPQLEPTEVVGKGEFFNYPNSNKKQSKWIYDTLNLSKEERSKARSKTFPGIAKAMVKQWGAYLKHKDLF